MKMEKRPRKPLCTNLGDLLKKVGMGGGGGKRRMKKINFNKKGERK